jgi:hypothetical protein
MASVETPYDSLVGSSSLGSNPDSGTFVNYLQGFVSILSFRQGHVDPLRVIDNGERGWY